MNIYRRVFFARCPENDKVIAYELEIATPDSRKIMVEHIDVACALCQPSHHEDIADFFFKQFGGQQVIKANHHGTDIETRRGFE